MNDKWRKLARLARHFRRIPFVDFVLVAGSMVLGAAREDSDFDVIVGARSGRIFTVRFLSYLWFRLIGARKGRGETGKRVKDKLCFNHFVTPASYRLAPPYNAYWEALYRRLVPIYGRQTSIDEFFAANADWAGAVMIDSRNQSMSDWFRESINDTKTLACRIAEQLLAGRIGDALEKCLKELQLKRIERHIAGDKGYKPQVRYDDEELRFHMDTRRIDEWLRQWYSREQ